jgi:hypothetical protein
MKEQYSIANVLEGKNAQQRSLILKDKILTQIFVCLYLCPGNCASDHTCPWRNKT